MKTFLAAAIAALALSGCATTRLSEQDRLALYREHAGQPVQDFSYFGSINGWTELGDSALAVWTRPNQAYLLELMGPCTDLEYAPAIAITNQMGRVMARFDDVLVMGGGRNSMRMPCRIETIRPLDVAGLRDSEKKLREVKSQPGAETGAGSEGAGQKKK